MAYSRKDSVALQKPCIALGPWIDRVGPNEAWLSWTLDRPAAVVVEYGSSQNRMSWQRISVDAALHSEIELTGLSADAEFGYRIIPEGRKAGIRVWTFRTSPEVGQWPVRGSVVFGYMSDSRAGAGGGLEAVDGTNRRMIRSLMGAADQSGIDFICFGGDLIDGYVDEPDHYRNQLKSWKKAAECVGPRIPIYEGMGNHEMLADFQDVDDDHKGMPPYRDKSGPVNSESLFAQAFVNPENGPAAPVDGRGKDTPPSFLENVYSFDWGPVHMVAMNNTYDVSSYPENLGGYREGAFPDEQLDWLDRDLAAARARGAVECFVFAHEPAFPCGGHAGDAMYWNGERPEILEIRDRFWNILQKHEVRAAMFGDEHNLSLLRVDDRMGPQYTRPVWNIVSGGVGAPYYAMDKTLPWADFVSVFNTIQHFCRIEVSPNGVTLSALDSHGRVIARRPLD
jgi:3',5'-cyclic AMP phosphodiesterase CpdA